jgi:hypothetical protein
MVDVPRTSLNVGTVVASVMVILEDLVGREVQLK